MSRNDLVLRLVAAFVGIVAIAFAAATISSPTESGGGVGDGGGGLPSSNPESAPGGFPPFLEELLLVLVVIVAIVLAWYYMHNRRDLVLMIAMAAGFLVILGAIGLLLQHADLSFLADSANETAMDGNATNESTNVGEGEGDSDANQQPFDIGTLLALVAGAATVIAGVVAFSRWRQSGVTTGTDVALEASDETAAVGAAAGRAADRIESDDETVENEIYRAWRRMTDHLDVERPETSTPGEFATAAVDAGMAREHVDELTRLFEDVRYGHADTTAEREERAVSVLRRIESEYADDDDGPDDTVSPSADGRSRGESR